MTIILIILILFILLYSMPIKIKILYSFKNRNNELEVYFKTLFGLLNKKIDISYFKKKLENKQDSKAKLNSESTNDEEDIHNKKKLDIEELKKSISRSKISYEKYKSVIMYFINKILIKELKSNTEFDFKDAAVTGIVAGILNAIQSNILLAIFRHKKIEDYRFNIKPLFNQENMIHINFSCIIQFKIGHIIYGSIKSLILYKRR